MFLEGFIQFFDSTSSLISNCHKSFGGSVNHWSKLVSGTIVRRPRKWLAAFPLSLCTELWVKFSPMSQFWCSSIPNRLKTLDRCNRQYPSLDSLNLVSKFDVTCIMIMEFFLTEVHSTIVHKQNMTSENLSELTFWVIFSTAGNYAYQIFSANTNK